MKPIDIETKKNEIQPDKLALIRAGLIGASFHLPHDEVFIYPFMDYLYLLFQPGPDEDPIAFLFWKNGKCIHSSFRDLYYTKKYNLSYGHSFSPPDIGIQLSKSHDLWLSVHRIKTEVLRTLDKQHGRDSSDPIHIDIDEMEMVLPTDNHLMEQVAIVLNHEGGASASTWLGLSPHIMEQFRQLLVQTVETNRTSYPWCPVEDRNLIELDYADEVLPLLSGFRTVLDTVFEDASASQAMQFANHQPALGNVFCAIRTVPSGKNRLGAFPFSAGLLLSSNQWSTLRTWCEKGCAGKKSGLCPVSLDPDQSCMADLEIPLGPLSRSVADTIFCSGVIDFGRRPDDDVWDRTDSQNPTEQRRQNVEKCIYPSKDSASLYYVPIHVEGLPWLSIFTFSPATNSQDRWLHNYTFYRDVIQRAASRLRVAATSEYLAQASEIASNNIDIYTRAPEIICDKVNRSWEVLARIYPMPMFQLHYGRPSNTANTGPSTIMQSFGNWYVTCTDDLHPMDFDHDKGRDSGTQWPNPFFGPPQVRWGRSDPSTLLKTLIMRIESHQAKRWQLLETSGQARAKVAHAIQTQLNNLEGSILKIRDRQEREHFDYHFNTLVRAANYAMAEFDQRRKDRLLETFVTTTSAGLLTVVKQSAVEVLNQIAALADTIGSAAAKRAKEMKAAVQLHTSLSDSSNLVLYCPEHIRQVLTEFLVNAVKYSSDESKEPTIEITCGQEKLNRTQCFIRVSNQTHQDQEVIESLCHEMTHGQEPRLSVMTLRTYCSLWDYVWPSWEAQLLSDGKTKIVATCQIGNIAKKGKEVER